MDNKSHTSRTSRKSSTRLLSFLLTVLMVVTMIPLPSYAPTEATPIGTGTDAAVGTGSNAAYTWSYDYQGLRLSIVDDNAEIVAKHHSNNTKHPLNINYY